MLKKTRSHLRTVILPAFILIFFIETLTQYAQAQQPALKITAQTNVSIILPAETILPEETAANELKHYLSQITGATCRIIPENDAVGLTGILIYIGPTQFAQHHLQSKSTFGDEEWLMLTSGNALILDGGRPRGTLYAVYHFLEDVCGVHWWNPWEETVPGQKVLSVPMLNKRSEPAFGYRDIYTLYANDNGRFMARSRLNRQGNTPVDAAYGGAGDYYGPPDHVHTFSNPIYIDPQKYSSHPDWFIIKGAGPPTVRNAQLAMSNPEMRKEFLRLLLQNIRNSRKEALAKNLPLPTVYDVSQNDSKVGFIGSPEDAALVKENGGAESAVLLDFINYLADGVKEEFPDIFIDTVAYYSGEQAPTNMSARDNVIIRLTDTQSNVLLPITADRNHVMRENVENWAKHCKNLRIWDYDITFAFWQLPQPTSQTYAPDLRSFREHGVKGMFIELEEPIYGDMRDMKLWILCKMLEDPDQDYNALLQEFTDGYYGAAGSYIRQYLANLQSAAIKSTADIGTTAGIDSFTYLTTEFLQQANDIYEKAAGAVESDPVLSRRVAVARASVDFAILKRARMLGEEWRREGRSESTFPLDRDDAGKRYSQAMNAQIEMWLPKAAQKAEKEKLQNTVASLTSGPVFSPLPAKFKDVPAKNVFVFGAMDTRNWNNLAKVVRDTDAESGYATRYEIPDNEISKYELPMPWGVYDDSDDVKTILKGSIKPDDIPGAGYHWYKLGDTTLTSHAYMYFFWSWVIQNDIFRAYDPKAPDAKYEIWANIKFEGPAFPFAKAGDKNAISLERIVVVRK